MKQLEWGPMTIRIIVFMFMLGVLFLYSYSVNAEDMVWDCPGCGRTGITKNYCGNCAYPAPWIITDPEAINQGVPDYVDQSADFEYKISGSQAIITKYRGKGGTVFIPERLGGKPVKTIPSDVFMGNNSITCIVIPEGVTKIDKAAFYDNSLEEIYIPSSLISIGNEAFTYSKTLKAIHVDLANKNFTAIDGILFSASKDTLIVYPCKKKDKKYIVPETVKKIADGAFSLSKLESVILQNGVTDIGRLSFDNCMELKELSLPGSVTKINDLAFGSYNYNMTRIDVASDNKKYTSVDGVLFDKGMKTLLQYPNSRTDAEYTIPDTVTKINKEAFGNSRYLKKIIISAKMKSIDDYQFYACDLESVFIPKGLTKIGNYAFAYSGDIHVTVPSSVKLIGKNAFDGCTNSAIEGKKGSYAEEFALENHITFIGTLSQDDLKKVGNTVQFGHYEQDNNLLNGSEPIEWIVMNAQKGKSLLLSKYGLDVKAYNTSYTKVTWENCTLRKWLNEVFLNEAFSPKEQTAILIMNIENKESSTKAENSTRDQIFLMSYHEAFELYFKSDADRICIPTEYAVAHGAYHCSGKANERGTDWWLRTLGNNRDSATSVYRNGDLNYYVVSFDGGCVRPALCINQDSDIF